jgi:hypothetical protein
MNRLINIQTVVENTLEKDIRVIDCIFSKNLDFFLNFKELGFE